MKIDLVLTACDMNHHYLNLLPYVFKTWKNKFNIKCQVILISNNIPDILLEYSENIILFEPMSGISTAFIAQVIRILYPCLYDNQNILITDADIIPVSKEYFIDSVQQLPNDVFICYRDAYIKQQMLGICYNLANSTTWKEIFKIDTLEDVKNTINKWYNPSYNGFKNCIGWYTDQQKLFQYVMNWENKDRVVILKDRDLRFCRLDKRQKDYIVNNIDKVKSNISNHIYTDFHVIKPFSTYQQIISLLVDTIND